MVADQVLDVLAHWKSDFYNRYGVSAKMFVIDDGWDTYGEWQFHSGFPNEMRDIAAAAKEMDGAGVGAWLGPVGGYGQSGNYRRDYWNKKGGGMQLSNPAYYAAFKKAAKVAQKQAHIPGFRVGKAPLEIVAKRYADYILEDVERNLQGAAFEQLSANEENDKLDIVSFGSLDAAVKDGA